MAGWFRRLVMLVALGFLFREFIRSTWRSSSSSTANGLSKRERSNRAFREASAGDIAGVVDQRADEKSVVGDGTVRGAADAGLEV